MVVRVRGETVDYRLGETVGAAYWRHQLLKSRGPTAPPANKSDPAISLIHQLKSENATLERRVEMKRLRDALTAERDALTAERDNLRAELAKRERRGKGVRFVKVFNAFGGKHEQRPDPAA